jgi:two-component system, cell cycle response regulator
MSTDDDWDEATKAATSPGEDLGEHQEKAYLIVLTGNRLGSMIEVRHGMVVGRSHGTDFQIPEEGISRQHVRILFGPDGRPIIEDMGSLNGTFVNGKRINAGVLSDGDKIRVGTTTILKFSYADKLEEDFQLQLREAALHDPLTQVFNRRSLDDHLAREVAFSLRHQSALSLILFDLDHFKNVNDTRGHPVGDELLCSLASGLQRQIRREDILARYGGEEFALLCRGISGAVAFAVADRLRLSVASQALVSQLPDLLITVSGGVAAMPSPDLGSVRDLVEATDQALYRAKHEGRNRVILHECKVPVEEAPPARPGRRPATGGRRPPSHRKKSSK